MLTVFRLSWIAIIVVVKARAGVVSPPQAIEHGTFSSLLENRASTHALQVIHTGPVSISATEKSFQVLI